MFGVVHHVKRKCLSEEAVFGSVRSFSIYLEILFLFAHDVNSGQAIKMLAGEAGSNSIYTWYIFYCDVMSRTLLAAPIRLESPNTIVKIDESKWGNKRKYNRGTNKCKQIYTS